MRHIDSLKRFSQRADLVDLHEDRVADAALNPVRQAGGVGDKEIVADQLQMLGSKQGGSAAPQAPKQPELGPDDFDDDIPF